MKKSLKVYLSAWGIVIVVFAISLVIGRIQSGRDERMIECSKDPAKVEKILKIDLPDISSVESDDLTGSQYSTYICYMYFAEPLSEDVKVELEKRCKAETTYWEKYDDSYYFSKNIQCHIYEDYAEVSFETVDSLSLIVYLGMLLLICGLPILLVWGLVLGVISLVRKNRKDI